MHSSINYRNILPLRVGVDSLGPGDIVRYDGVDSPWNMAIAGNLDNFKAAFSFLVKEEELASDSREKA